MLSEEMVGELIDKIYSFPISKYLNRKGLSLIKEGEEYVKTFCPLCISDTIHPQLYLRDGINAFVCFSCGSSGDLMDLVNQLEGVFPLDLSLEEFKRILKIIGINSVLTEEDLLLFEEKVTIKKRGYQDVADSYFRDAFLHCKFEMGNGEWAPLD